MSLHVNTLCWQQNLNHTLHREPCRCNSLLEYWLSSSAPTQTAPFLAFPPMSASHPVARRQSPHDRPRHHSAHAAGLTDFASTPGGASSWLDSAHPSPSRTQQGAAALAIAAARPAAQSKIALWICRMYGVWERFSLVGLGSGVLVSEGDRESVDRWLPPHNPSRPARVGPGPGG